MTCWGRERSAPPLFMAQTGRTLRDANPNDGFLAGIVCQQYRPSRKSSVATTFILVISITVRYFLDISFCISQKFVNGISHLCQFHNNQVRHASVGDSGSRLCHKFDLSMRKRITPLLRSIKEKENWCAGSCDMKLAQPYNKKGDGPIEAEKKAKQLLKANKNNKETTEMVSNPEIQINDFDEKEQKHYEEPIGTFDVDLLNKIKSLIGVGGVEKLIECNNNQCETHECTHCKSLFLFLSTEKGLNQAIDDYLEEKNLNQ